jgi:hypothetical protein
MEKCKRCGLTNEEDSDSGQPICQECRGRVKHYCDVWFCRASGICLRKTKKADDSIKVDFKKCFEHDPEHKDTFDKDYCAHFIDKREYNEEEV